MTRFRLRINLKDPWWKICQQAISCTGVFKFIFNQFASAWWNTFFPCNETRSNLNNQFFLLRYDSGHIGCKTFNFIYCRKSNGKHKFWTLNQGIMVSIPIFCKIRKYLPKLLIRQIKWKHSNGRTFNVTMFSSHSTFIICPWYPVEFFAFKLTKLAIMAILASEALLREKNPVAKCHPWWE